MDLIGINLLSPQIIVCTLGGCAGGFVSFLYALRHGHYRNNKLIKKFSVEVVGATFTALFLVSAVVDQIATIAAASFVLGVVWVKVIQLLRQKVTKIVEAILGEDG